MTTTTTQTLMHMEIMVSSTSKKSMKDAAKGIPAPLVSHTACHLATPVRKTTHVGLVTCPDCVALAPKVEAVVEVPMVAEAVAVVSDRLAGVAVRQTRKNAPLRTCALCPNTFFAHKARICASCWKSGKRLPKAVKV